MKKQLLLLPILIPVVVTGTATAKPAGPARAASNPYTTSCPGNTVRYGIPKGRTASAKARQKVFGRPYPNANTQQIDFMGKKVWINKKIAPCLNAVEWDLKNKYRTKYKPDTIYGASTLSSQNTDSYFHAYGGAVDINPQENPQCRGGCSYKMPKTWVKAFRDHGFFWGGSFKTDKDYMHFEWHGQK